MQKLNYLLVSLAILTGCFWPAPRDGHAAALGRRSATLSLAPVQFPDDQHLIYQNERQVGEIYSPGNDIKATRYVEHWVLYDGYVYPGKDQKQAPTMIRSASKSDYESETDFFARVPWGAGYRYVRVDCTEYDNLPGR